MRNIFETIGDSLGLWFEEIRFCLEKMKEKLFGPGKNQGDYGRGIFYIGGSDVLPPPLSPE